MNPFVLFSLSSVPAAYTHMLVSDLEPGETYKIRIAATNINGTGPFTDWVVARTEEISKKNLQ